MLLFAVLFAVTWASCPENYQHDVGTNRQNFLLSQENFSRCLKVFNQPKTFFNAQLECTKEDGNLAAIPKDKNIHELLPKKVYTGLNKLLSSEWKHLDHTPVHPTVTLGLITTDVHRCAVYNVETSSYDVVSCDTALPFICSRPILPAPAQNDACPSCPSPCYANCDNGWTYFDKTGACYKTFFNSNQTAAEKICRAHQSHLVSIHSNAENLFVIDLSSTGMYGYSYTYMVWTGLYLNLGNWVWTDGTPANYTTWTSGAPQGSTYPCSFLYADVNGYRYGQWDVDYCDRSMRAFVCKKAATSG